MPSDSQQQYNGMGPRVNSPLLLSVMAILASGLGLALIFHSGKIGPPYWFDRMLGTISVLFGIASAIAAYLRRGGN